MSLRTRIAAAAGIAVAIAVLAGAIAAYLGIRGELRGGVDDALRNRIADVSEHLPPFGVPFGAGGGPPFDADRPEGPRRFGGAEGIVQFVAPDGLPLRPRGQPQALPVDGSALAIARAGAGESLRDAHVAGVHLRVLTRGIGSGALQVARPLDEVDRALDRVLAILAVTALGGIAVAAGLGLAVARTALAPIARFTRRTEELAGDPDPHHRMEVTGDDELGRLARSFNTTLDALARSVEAQRHLVADASHELRTPIASLRANVQVLEDADRLPPEEAAALRDDIVSELDELTALVADVVELARGSRPAESMGDVRLDLVVASLAERAQRRAGDALTFEVDLEPTVVTGDGERIGRAVSNLLDNARKWSPPGGRVEVTLRDGTVCVRDHGPGFADADLPRIFERFYRSDAARGMPGSGLGLAIVRQAAEEHGGGVGAANADGGGAVVRVSFGPSAAPPETDGPLLPPAAEDARPVVPPAVDDPRADAAPPAARHTDSADS